MSTGVATSTVVGFHEFWSWLEHHFNCIVEAGGPDFTLFDLPDVHWHLEEAHDGVHLVQLYRAKVLCGEMVLRADAVIGVTMRVVEEGARARFECVVASDEGQVTAYHFVMAHGMDTRGRWTH